MRTIPLLLFFVVAGCKYQVEVPEQTPRTTVIVNLANKDGWFYAPFGVEKFPGGCRFTNGSGNKMEINGDYYIEWK